ncbi:MAG: membrane dipeptidase [Actinobacteria bacterium]|nr:membrane dipeptidase [Actinomycetota bacterium]
MGVDSPRLIADAHNDLLLELAFRARAGERGNLFARHWLPQLERGGVGLQVCPVSAPLEADREAALRAAVEQVAAFERATRENADRVVAVRSRADLEEVEHGRIGLVLSLEGAEPLGEDVGSAEAFFELGVRMVSLTWNTSNAFASGAAGTGGLTALGAKLVDRLAELGVILDLVHASEATFWDVLERCGEAQLVVSHAACRALLDHPRNLSDEQLRAVAERGGVLCLMQLPLVIDHEHPVIDRVVDHLDHAVSVMGIDRVGLGADFIRQVSRALRLEVSPTDTLLPAGMTLDAAIEGLAGPEDYPRLVAALRGRGYAGERLDAVLGGNLTALLRTALPEPP